MMTATQWLSPWRKPANPARAHRPRRPWHLELVTPLPSVLADADEPGEGFDNSWFESSRALAEGLRVTEHMAPVEALLQVAPGGI